MVIRPEEMNGFRGLTVKVVGCPSWIGINFLRKQRKGGVHNYKRDNAALSLPSCSLKTPSEDPGRIVGGQRQRSSSDNFQFTARGPLWPPMGEYHLSHRYTSRINV